MLAEHAASRLIVVKIGSGVIAPGGSLDRPVLLDLAAQVARARAAGSRVAIVSSGAVACGMPALGLTTMPTRIVEKQAAAAIGQAILIRAWDEALDPARTSVAQVLLTAADLDDRARFLNARHTLETLLARGIVPIINEKDTVATDEIRFGDNDRLAARVALMAGADMLVLLSDVDGLYSANPREDAGARRLDVVEAVTPEIEAMASGVGTEGASGGMVTKLMAAKTATKGGCAMAICRGDVDRPLSALGQGAPAT
ncbi:MAG: glutamate 5-kinase, partial [Planctomycetota bacterium]